MEEMNEMIKVQASFTTSLPEDCLDRMSNMVQSVTYTSREEYFPATRDSEERINEWGKYFVHSVCDDLSSPAPRTLKITKTQTDIIDMD